MNMLRSAGSVALSMAVLLAAAGCHGTKTGTRQKTVAKPAASPSQRAGRGDNNTTRRPDGSVHTPPVTGRLAERILSTGKPTGARSLPANHPLHQKWPRAIETATLSPDGKTVAIFDRRGVYLTLTDTQSRRVRALRITLFEHPADEHLTVCMAFRPDGRRLAILTTLVYGEPLGAFIERLWTADVATGRVRRLSEWADRVQGRGPITAEREIEGWSADGKSVIVSGVVYDGLEMPADAREAGTERIPVKDAAR